jgi:hypothetical protein
MIKQQMKSDHLHIRKEKGAGK